MVGRRKTVGALALAGIAVLAVRRTPRPQAAAPEAVAVAVALDPVPQPAPPARTSWRRRAAVTLAYTTLFFAGGAVVAGAGNELAQVDPESTTAAVVATDATVTETDTTTTAADVTTTTDGTTTTDVATTATEEPPPVTTPDAADVPDPSDATPPLVADAGTPSAAPATHAAPVAAHAPRHAAAHRAAAPVSSPFPVLTFDPRAWLVAHPGTAAGDAAVAIAEQYLGVPYRWGGATPSTGFDCSGLTQFVYAQLGVWLPHYAAAQFLAYARVDPTQLEPGDLVFFEPKPDGPGHVAIYAGGDVIVEAPHTGAVVRLGSLTGAATSLGFLGAVRPSGGTSPRTLQPFALVATTSAPGNWLALAV
jgi:cell wall-associated NlpC family hydrolase